MGREAGALVLKRALQIAEYILVGAMCVISFVMAVWNAGVWLISL